MNHKMNYENVLLVTDGTSIKINYKHIAHIQISTAIRRPTLCLELIVVTEPIARCCLVWTNTVYCIWFGVWSFAKPQWPFITLSIIGRYCECSKIPNPDWPNYRIAANVRILKRTWELEVQKNCAFIVNNTRQ